MVPTTSLPILVLEGKSLRTLYCNRIISAAKDGLKILITYEDGDNTTMTSNVVYHEVVMYDY